MLKQTYAVVLWALILSCPHTALAKDPTGNADNAFGNNGAAGVPDSAYEPGRNERDSESYKKKTDPNSRDYYEKGGAQTNHDDPCRARLAYKAARYQGPKNGYDGLDPRPGGGDYGDFPRTPEEIISNIYKFVEDMLYPRQGSDAPWYEDKKLCEDIESGTIDIGKPLPDPDNDAGYACIVAAHLFTSLVRELGFPAREKNIVYSNSEGKFSYQTAAANVWYGGEWHFFDPWESFRDPKNYLNGEGHVVSAGDFHDAELWIRDSAPAITGGALVDNEYFFLLGAPLDSGWGTKPETKMKLDGTEVKVESAGFFLGVKKDGEWYAGRLPSGEQALLGEPQAVYVKHEDLIPRTRLDPPGPDTYGYELITLLHNGAAPGRYPFTAVLSNVGAEAQDYKLEITAMPVTRHIKVQVKAQMLSGVVAPGRQLEFPFVVIIGDAIPLPPEPVTNIDGRLLEDGRVELKWPPVADAAQYRLYRSDRFIKALPDVHATRLDEVSAPGYTLAMTDADFILITAVNANGLESALDFETGSVYVLDPDYPDYSEKIAAADSCKRAIKGVIALLLLAGLVVIILAVSLQKKP
jgi:hypothetical protein